MITIIDLMVSCYDKKNLPGNQLESQETDKFNVSVPS